jgi:hypothetical protein
LVEAGLSGVLSWRRFLILVRGLPVGSAYARWLKDKDNRSLAEWDEESIMHEIQGVKGGRK